MKAKAGFMLLILLMCFTGFGQTTSDLTKNSTAEVHDVIPTGDVVETPVSVVTADFTLVVLQDEVGTESIYALHSEKANEAIVFLNHANCEATPINLTKSDLKVGWHFGQNRQATHRNMDDPGGVMSLFYI